MGRVALPRCHSREVWGEDCAQERAGHITAQALESAGPLDGGLFELPSSIDADSHVALTGRVVQGPKASPYLLCASLRRIEAHHPNRADRRASITITITGARRGAGAPLIDEALGAFSAPDKNGLMTFDETVIESMGGPGPYVSGGGAR